MGVRRNRRAGIEDRWNKTMVVTAADGSRSKSRVHSAQYGCKKRWRARYVDDEGNEHAKGFERKTDAQAWLNEATSALVTGNHVAPSAGRRTVGEVGETWLDSQPHLKETTGSTRRYTWGPHVKPRWGTVQVRDVRAGDVRTWVADMVKAGIGVPTIENAVGVLRMILATQVEDRQIPRNPCSGVKLPRRSHKARGYLTHRQVLQLASEVTENPEVVRFLAYTGLRWGEMAALQVSSFDMARCRVNVIEAVAEVEGRVVWSTAKNHERRSVPFPKILAPELSALMRGRARDALVFTSTGGEVLRVSNYRPRVFKPAVARIQKREAQAALLDAVTDDQVEARPGFPSITPHDLRHTAASLAISAGANPKAVQTMLGHKSAAMTLDVYADLFPDDLEAVASALNTAAEAAELALSFTTADVLRTTG